MTIEVMCKMTFITKQWKVCFAVSKDDFKRGKMLPYSFNISEEIGSVYQKILDKARGLK